MRSRVVLDTSVILGEKGFNHAGTTLWLKLRVFLQGEEDMPEVGLRAGCSDIS